MPRTNEFTELIRTGVSFSLVVGALSNTVENLFVRISDRDRQVLSVIFKTILLESVVRFVTKGYLPLWNFYGVEVLRSGTLLNRVLVEQMFSNLCNKCSMELPSEHFYARVVLYSLNSIDHGSNICKRDFLRFRFTSGQFASIKRETRGW